MGMGNREEAQVLPCGKLVRRKDLWGPKGGEASPFPASWGCGDPKRQEMENGIPEEVEEASEGLGQVGLGLG